MFLFLSLIAFSETAIKDTIPKSIVIPERVGREIIKDLIRKDSLQSELNSTQELIKLYTSNLSYKDNIITLKDSSISLYKHKELNYTNQLSLKDEQIKSLNELSNKLNKDLKKAKVNLTFRTTVGIVAIGTILYLFLK